MRILKVSKALTIAHCLMQWALASASITRFYKEKQNESDFKE